MASRTTEWRHRTGRSKKRYPKGDFDHKGVAISISMRFFHDLRYLHPEDLQQEIELLVIEAISKKRVAGSRKAYGNGRDRMGIVLFSRATQARLHAMRKRYGIYRNKHFFSLEENRDRSETQD